MQNRSTKAFVDEFLFRGRPEGSDMPSDWHVVLGAYVTDPIDPKAPQRLHLASPMTPDQAAAAGFDLPTVLSAINLEVVRAHDHHKARAAALASELADHKVAAAQRDAAAVRQVDHLHAMVREHLPDKADAIIKEGTERAGTIEAEFKFRASGLKKAA